MAIFRVRSHSLMITITAYSITQGAFKRADAGREAFQADEALRGIPAAEDPRTRHRLRSSALANGSRAHCGEAPALFGAEQRSRVL